MTPPRPTPAGATATPAGRDPNPTAPSAGRDLTLPRVSTTDRVHAALRDEIVAGQLEAGSLHSIYDFAARYGVSRTPVRDAVLRLADAGLVVIERNRGVRIRGLTVRDVYEVFDVRLALEVTAAGRAAARALPALTAQLDVCMAALSDAAGDADTTEFARLDRALHDVILAAAGNRRSAELVAGLRDTTQSYGVSTAGRSRSARDIHAEHLPVVEAIRRGDARGAEQAMHDHLTHTALLLMRQVAEDAGEEAPSSWDGYVPAQE